MIFFDGIFLLPDQCMVRRWSWSLCSLVFCTQLGWDEVARIKSVGSLSKGGPSRSDLFIMHSPILLQLHFLWRAFGKIRLHREVFFVWMTVLGKILTLDNLRKRHVIVMDWCCMCNKNGKTIDHHLLHCEMARALWVLIYRLFGL